MAPSVSCASLALVSSPIDCSVRLRGEKCAQSPAISNFESTAVLLAVSANSRITTTTITTPLQPSSAPPTTSSSNATAAEDLETPPLAHKEGGTENDDETQCLPALLARLSRPPPFPLEGNEDEEGGEETEEEREQALSAAASDEASSSSSALEQALSSLALADES